LALLEDWQGFAARRPLAIVATLQARGEALCYQTV
jgi:hypothetical protein